MWRLSQKSEDQHYDHYPVDLDHVQTGISQCVHSLPRSASSSEITSPTPSYFSKMQSTRPGSTGSSVASSPTMRESLDTFTPQRTLLTDVKEEPQERDDVEAVNAVRALPRYTGARGWAPPELTSLTLPSTAHIGFDEYESSEDPYPVISSPKKRRSVSAAGSLVPNRISTRFGTLSRNWRSRTSIGPKLSLTTDTSIMTRARNNSVPTQLASPALSVISKHESLADTSSIQESSKESLNKSFRNPDTTHFANTSAGMEEEDQGQATTPLLPPAMNGFFSSGLSLNSPLQSPTVAELTPPADSTTPDATPQFVSLPTPPLSTKPSLASVRQRSRAGTLVPSSEIPPLSMLGPGEGGLWERKLGHADFTISPEPYSPQTINAYTFRQFREDWDLARQNYAKHLARTGEHYGTTSKTFLLTEEKWSLVDSEWKQYNEELAALVNSIGPIEKDATNGSRPDGLLERPPPKVSFPTIHHPSGKFPDMGDEDIVGPMTVVPTRAKSSPRIAEPMIPTRTSKKRSFFRFLSDFLGRRA